MPGGEMNEPETNGLRNELLAYGMEHSYRVVILEEVARVLSVFPKPAVQNALNQLADEGLVSRFVGRYCFNQELPSDVCEIVAGSMIGSQPHRRSSA